MPESCILYYITDRKAFPGDEHSRRRCLLDKIAEAVRAGIDYIQLREKDLCAKDLESLAREAMRIIRAQNRQKDENPALRTALLINSRTDVALAAGTNGVHLPADDLPPKEVRQIWRSASWCGAGAPSTSSGQVLVCENSPRDPVISVSCHSQLDVAQAAANSCDLALFAPVFEKKAVPETTPTGLEVLHQACRAKIPVLALGGITLQNAASCLQAGASGIAAIRLFQENTISSIARTLRGH
jgi:thiamine-phosphate pyrophosphorylase